MIYEFKIKLIPVTSNMEIILDDNESNKITSDDTTDRLFCSNIIVKDKPLTIKERNKYINRFIDDIIIDNSNVEIVKVRSLHLSSEDDRVERREYFATVKLSDEAFIPSRSKTKEVDKINRTKVKMVSREGVEAIKNG